jgi:hypothetical protein
MAPDIANLSHCTEESRLAAMEGDAGPTDPTGYPLLLGRLESAKPKGPPLYLETLFTPFVATLRW